MFTSSGVLRYSHDPIKLIVEVDPGISKFYFSTIPKYLGVSKPMWDSHISVVRNVIPPDMSAWEKHAGREVSFEYENWVYNDELYYWLNVWSTDLEEVRRELGLKPYGDVTCSPDDRHRFHITLGNLKNTRAP